MLKIIKEDLIKYSEDKTGIFIVHVVNDGNSMGAGVALALLTKWPQVRSKYMSWFKGNTKDILNVSGPAKLGQVQYISTEQYKERYVVNMVGQSTPGGHIFTVNGKDVHLPPIRLQSLEECMYRVAEKIYQAQNSRGIKFDIVCPWFGCGLAGSTQSEIKPLIQKIWVDNGINVTICEQ